MNIFKRTLTGFVVFAAVTSLWATPASDLLDKLKHTYPNIAFSQVNETPVPGIYEALFGKDILYVEASGTYFFPTMVNMVTKVNLGEDRRADLNKIDFSELPLADAIKTTHGNGQRKIAVFADPNCGYCKKLEMNMAGLDDVTIYTFAVGILGADSVKKAMSLSCASGDKAKLWHSVLVEGAKPVDKTCANAASERNLELFKRFGFQGTPGIVFESGAVLKGYAENIKLEELMAKK